jgi:hypothetical protein
MNRMETKRKIRQHRKNNRSLVKNLTIRLSLAEEADLKFRCEARNMTPSDYIRFVLFKQF